MSFIPFRIRNYMERSRFAWQCRAVFATPPLRPREGDVTLLSMVSHRDLILYLLAIKSFYLRSEGGKIAFLDDGSLTQKDLTLLEEHLPFADRYSIDDVRPPAGCPSSGGCWERLTVLSRLSKNSYVIQVDTDTLCLGPPTEVFELVADQRSFVISGDDQQNEIVTFSDAGKKKRGTPGHVQTILEQRLPEHPDASSRKYVRGCAGFSGFAPGAASEERMTAVSREFANICGEDEWQQWGSEQITSNMLVVDSPNAAVLPFPQYAGYFPNTLGERPDCKLIHFIGANRFRHGAYAYFGRELIDGLLSGQQT